MAKGKLEGKVVIITGGNSGIGKASSILFANEGARVVIAARNAVSGEEVVHSIQKTGRGDAIFVQTDVSDPGDVERLVGTTMDHFGGVHVLYANSGVNERGTAPDTSIELWQRIIDVDLSGSFYLAKYGIPALIASGGHAIIMTASELGMVGTTATVAYCTAKGGIINMTRAIAIDCASYNIRVNCLAPGPIATPMKQKWLDATEDPAAQLKIQTDPVLLKRLGTPEEIAEVALFLASDGSSFMTGSLVVADGGCTAWYGM